MVRLLDILPEYVLHWFVQRGEERHVQASEVLLNQGERNTSLFIVLDGLFGSFVSTAPDRRLSHAPAGSVLGEISAFTDHPATTTIMAEEPSLVLELSRNAIVQKLKHDHEFAADFYRTLLVTVLEKLHAMELKHSAAEEASANDVMQNPLVKKAQSGIDRFKSTVLDLDKEAMKKGTLAEERCQEFLAQTSELMHLCHNVIGSDSPLSDPVKQLIGTRLQHEMLPYLLTTETAERFYSKPRGYAGDYLAIHNIYRNVPGGSGRLGPLLDRMFLEAPPARAVRNRRALLAGEIAASVRNKPDGVVKVMCMASGPATEVFDAISTLENPGRLRATLMDIDLQALAFVDDIRSKRKLSNQVTLVNENLIALFLGRTKTKIEPQDLIYSIGLIDYLNDKLVNKLLQYVHENLAPGGRVILGTFHPANPAKEFMDYVLEWNLIHRTEEDMNRLFMSSPFNRACTKMQFESEGVNLFAECVKD